MKQKKQSSDTTNKKESSSLSGTIAKGVVKLIFESLNRTIKDWETRSSTKDAREITRRYEIFEKRMHGVSRLKVLKYPFTAFPVMVKAWIRK